MPNLRWATFTVILIIETIRLSHAVYYLLSTSHFSILSSVQVLEIVCRAE